MCLIDLPCESRDLILEVLRLQVCLSCITDSHQRICCSRICKETLFITPDLLLLDLTQQNP